MTHPYFTDKARRAFEAAGGDPEKATALASWAESAKYSDTRPAGVIVAADGSIVANTISIDGAVYIRDGFRRFGFQQGDELAMVLSQIPAAIGQQVAYFKAWMVCGGGGIWVEPIEPRTRTASESDH